jgi:ERCC4-related helicase
MTYQVFSSVLEKGLLDMKQVNLLVLDECHNTVGDATLRDILSSCEFSPESPKPRILGLTSSIVNDKCQPIKLSRIISSLENTLKSVIHTSNNVLSALQYVL